MAENALRGFESIANHNVIITGRPDGSTFAVSLGDVLKDTEYEKGLMIAGIHGNEVDIELVSLDEPAYGGSLYSVDPADVIGYRRRYDERHKIGNGTTIPIDVLAGYIDDGRLEPHANYYGDLVGR